MPVTKRNESPAQFGNHLRALRHKRSVGQRELARAIGVSASYLNDIESNKRPAPRAAIIERITEILHIEDTAIHDLGMAELQEYNYLRLDPALPTYLKLGQTPERLAELEATWAEAMIQLVDFLYQQWSKDSRMALRLASR